MPNSACTMLDRMQIRPDSRFTSMSSKEKRKLLDSGKPLIVDFPLSHSGRLINDRIYTAWGQRAGVVTATSPYPKPVLLDHDRTSTSTIGRFVDAEWVSLSDEALGAIGSLSTLNDVFAALEQEDPEKIYDTLVRAKALSNANWPGIGAINAKIQITDSEAIERFLDGRYMSFSSGGVTDRYICSICYSDWFDQVCEHRPGTVYDGKLCVTITGKYKITEASVTPAPADDLSFVSSMRFEDSVSSDFKLALERPEKPKHFSIYDSKYRFPSKETPMENLGISDLANESTDFAKLLDDLNGETHIEMVHLVRIHDGLHSIYDWKIKYEDKESIPKDVFKLHEKLHMMSMEMGYRDSLVNGPLDKELMAQEGGAEPMSGVTNDDEEERKEAQGEEALLSDAALRQLADRLRAGGYLSDEIQPETWAALDESLCEEVHQDARLSDDERKALDDSIFIGANRTFPVHDKSHYMAALRLDYSSCSDKEASAIRDQLYALGRLKGWLTDEQRKALQAPSVRDALDSLAQRIQALEDKQEAAPEQKEAPPEQETVEEPAAVEDKMEEIPPLEDPNKVAVEDTLPDESKLSGFQKRILNTYREKQQFFGTAVADSYLATAKSLGWVSQDFDPANVEE